METLILELKEEMKSGKFTVSKVATLISHYEELKARVDKLYAVPSHSNNDPGDEANLS